MNTTTSGHEAEAAVAERLKKNGYKIMDMNWKTPRCEIDVIAKKHGVIYFVEVKYRVQEGQGSGFEYIISRKLGQLQFAARIWNQQHSWEGDYHLLAAEVSGLNFENISVEEL